MTDIKDSINANLEVIKEATTLLPEDMPEDTRKAWTGVPAQTEAAIALVEEGDVDATRKLICIEDATSKYANQITFWLYRHDLLTDDLTKKFRAIRTPEQTTADLAKEEEAYKKEEDELLAKRDEMVKRQDSYDLVQAVLGGYSVEDAKKKIEQQHQATARAMGAK